MATIFTKIVNGEIPSFKIWENEDFYAFLDINPISSGHTLLIPKKEYETILDLPDNLHADIWKHAKELSNKLKLAMNSKKIGVIVEGFDVPHAHIHLVPINNVGELNQKMAKPAKMEDLEKVCKLITQ